MVGPLKHKEATLWAMALGPLTYVHKMFSPQTYILGLVHMGPKSKVPSPTHGDGVPTLECQQNFKIWFTSIKVEVGLFYENFGTCVECWVYIFTQPNSQYKSQASPSKSDVIYNKETYF